MVGNPIDRDILVFEALVDLFQIVEAVHHPGHMIQANLPLLWRRRIMAHLNERHFVRLLQIGRQECRTTGNEVIGMQTEDICIPLWERSAFRTKILTCPRYFGV